MSTQWVLIIDDDEEMSEVLSLLLESEGYSTSVCSTPMRAIETMRSREFAAVLLDLRLGEHDGLALLPRLREISPEAPIFMITAHGDVDSAVGAFRHGATGYIRKPFEEGDLKRQLAAAIGERTLRAEAWGKATVLAGAKTQDVSEIFRSRSVVMEPILRRIRMAALVKSNVVITGESGTGKELVARSLHFGGVRADQPFVAINCAALPETLLEAELFGHARGAFTDAKENRPGLFVRAHRGTLFLDEIGDAPPSIQAKLLRVLQEREVTPLGGAKSVPVDVRVVAATHRNLLEEVDAGRFRRDLYFRLHVLPIEVPPLRVRVDDIHFLALHLAKRISEEIEVAFEGFTPGGIRALEAHEWPGNVRELQNRIEHAMAISAGGKLNGPALFPEFAQDLLANGESEETELAETDDSNSMISFKEAKRTFEKSYLERVLAEARGNVTRAARLAEKSRAEVYTLIRKYGLKPELFKRT